MHGWLNCFKPGGLTSHQVVAQVRRILGVKKIGHAGTLDPFASGVLPLAVGEATKTLAFCVAKLKTYCFEMQWGRQTDTGDLTGQIIAQEDADIPLEGQLQASLQNFLGGYEQVPPQYSALKIQGKRACDLVRSGISVNLKARFVKIFTIDLKGYDAVQKKTVIEVTCGPGTYIRALAEDIAKAHQRLAHVSRLERMRVGNFFVKDAISLETLQNIGHKVLATPAWVPITTVLDDIPAICLKQKSEIDLRFGRCIPVEKVGANPLFEGTALCVNQDNLAVAIVEIKAGKICPKRVLNIK